MTVKYFVYKFFFFFRFPVCVVCVRDSPGKNTMIMKFPGSTESPQSENPVGSVGYSFPRHPNEQEFQQFPPKQPTWPTGDDAIINVSSVFFFGFLFFFLF